MTLLETSLVLQHILQILGKPITMTIEQFNSLAKIAQDELFKEFSNGYMSGNGYAVDMRITNALLPFWRSNILSGTNGALGSLNTNSYTVPTTAITITSCVIVSSGSLPTSTKKVDIVTDTELEERLGNAITYPTISNPIAILYGVTPTTKTLHLLPQQAIIPYLSITYLSRPTTPILVETISNGVRTTGSGTVEFTFDALFHIDILRIMLKYLGLSIGNEFITQMVEQQKMNEK